MTKFALLSGADKNAGDFLITLRSKQLLQEVIPSCEVIEIKRNYDLENDLPLINSCDGIVLAGGPGYLPNVYPGKFPLVSNLERIKPRMLALGMGIFSSNAVPKRISFTSESRVLLDRLALEGNGLGARDQLTVDSLKMSGYNDVILTGCPAWYDLRYVGMNYLEIKPDRSEISCIGVSDAALPNNIQAPKYLIECLKRSFPNAKIKLVFHRGWQADKYSGLRSAREQEKLVSWANSNGVESIDISYSHDGFQEYKKCDLHVGFRVHAHLYNISQRKPSYLIEEDGRGFGANDALGSSVHINVRRRDDFLGAISILLGASPKFYRQQFRKVAVRMTEHILNEINMGYPDSERACRVSSSSYSNIKEHIEMFNKKII